MRAFTYEEEFAVIKPYDKEILKKNDEPISMNIGIKNLLSILFELNHINYNIHGTLKGSVTFGKVNLLITKMELQIMKKETIYANTTNKKNIITKIISTYELIDGGPYKNETIPFRLFLSTYNLTPTYIDIASYFSTRYFLNLVIIDQENNRYFKQKEIFLFRLYINPKEKINNSNNNIDQLKNYITEPIDYGDYFSSFNNDDENKEENYLDNKFKEPKESDFYFKSNLKGFINDDNENDNEEENDKNIINIKRSNSVFNINHNKNVFEFNDGEININNDNSINNFFDDDNLVIENKKKSSSAKKNKKGKKQNQVINIKEKNKYKNNDILINDNYYNVDNYIIYENSYNNIFDNKLKTSRIKNNISENKNNINNNININNNKEEKLDDDDNNINNNINDIDDFKLYFPNEPFSNTLIMNNLPSNYSNIGNGENDFRKNLMGERIKKPK